MAYELIRVSELAELSTPADVNVLPIQAGDTLKKITFANLKGAAVGDIEGSLAADYDSTATYAVGDYCIYEGQLYRCTTAITTAEAWTSGHWTTVVLTDDMASAIAAEALTRSTNDNALAADIAEALGDLAAVYSTSATYAVGDYCIYQGQLYRCTTAITTAEAWTAAHWSVVALGDDTRDLRSAFSNIAYTDVGKNLYNPDTKLDQKYLNITNGVISDYSSTAVTDFIPVAVGKYVTFSYKTSSGRTAYPPNSLLFYDNTQTYISNSGAAWASSKIVPSGASYVRVCFGRGIEDFQVELTDDGVFTSYEPYTETYHLDTDIIIPSEQVSGLESETVKGTNLVTTENTHIGTCYYSNGIKTDTTLTSYRYVVVSLKQNTLYFVNAGCRYYIFTDDNDSVISYGSTPLGQTYFNSGTATRLYYTVSKTSYDSGFIIAEGYSGTLQHEARPDFVQGINQRSFDSWFAVAIPPRIVRFTVGIPERLYNFNMLALNTNILLLTTGARKEDGIQFDNASATTESNAWGYTVYDNNLSVVAKSPRGSQNRLTVYADNVQNCSALLIGDSIIARNSGKIGSTMLDAFTERSKTLTLLGTLGSGDNKHEGRAGWSTSDYLSDKQYEGVTNPFYNPVEETFDFSYYATNNNISAVDFIVIHLGGNDLFSIAFDEARSKIAQTEENMFAIIDSILSWNVDQKIIVCLAPTISLDVETVAAITLQPIDVIRAKFVNYNAEMLVLLTKYGTNVRCANDYMIVDPANDLADHIHPTNTGLAKIGMELVSQINGWQHDLQ